MHHFLKKIRTMLSAAGVAITASKRSLLLTTSLIIGACFAGAILCLQYHDNSNVLRHLDCFPAIVMLINVLFILQHVHFYYKLPPTIQVVKEAFGVTYDPAMGRFNVLLLFCESFVFLDYAHWHLSPLYLRQAGLQYAGLCLYLLALGMVIWADQYLARHFASSAQSGLITEGPYRYIRHPRYAGLFLSRVGFALVFGSLLEWGIILGWFLVVWRRIRIEERHLSQKFGEEYTTYMRKTARLLPTPCSRCIKRRRCHRP